MLEVMFGKSKIDAFEKGPLFNFRINHNNIIAQHKAIALVCNESHRFDLSQSTVRFLGSSPEQSMINYADASRPQTGKFKARNGG